MEAASATPTARSFSETVAYLMGTTTASGERSVDMPYYRQYTYKKSDGAITQVQKCTAWSNSDSSCDKWENTNDLIPSGDNITSQDCDFNVLDINEYGEKCHFYSKIT